MAVVHGTTVADIRSSANGSIHYLFSTTSPMAAREFGDWGDSPELLTASDIVVM